MTPTDSPPSGPDVSEEAVPVRILAAVAAAWLVLRVWQVGWMPPYWSDVFLYQQQFLDIFVRGKTPYAGTFVPYPPLALAPLAVLRVFGPLTGHAFFIGFRALMVLAELGTFWLLFRLARELGADRRRAWKVVGVAALGFSLQPHLVLDRLDVVVSAFIVWAALESVRARPLALGVAALTGALFKVIPGLFALAVAGTSRSRRQVAAVVIAGVSAIVVVAALDVAVWPKLLSTLREHEQRGVQVESVWASLLVLGPLLSGAFVPEMVEVVYGAAHLRSDLVPGAVLLVSKLAGFGFAVLGGVRVVRAFGSGRISRPDVVAFTLAFTWLGAVAFQRVLSTQYFLWGTAALAWLLATRRALFAGWLVVLALSFVAFDLHYPDTPREWAAFLGWTTVRNAALVVFAALVERAFRSSLAPESASRAVSSPP